MLQLQQQIGNQAVLRMLSHTKSPAQTKATLNQPGDHYEQEASRVSGEATRLPQASPAPPSLPIQAKLEIGAVDDPLEREADRVAERVMRMPDPGSSSSNPPAASDTSFPHGQVQRAPASPPVTTGMEAPLIVHEVLRSPGQPLDAATRAFFEPRLRRGLSQVQIHSDARAAQSAKSIGAQAYTVGQHVVFANSRNAPPSADDDKLLGHELAHVVQQSGAAPTANSRISDDADAPEFEADGPIRAPAVNLLHVQRQPKPRAEVGSAMSAAQAELAEVEKFHDEGGDPNKIAVREAAAQQKAIAAAQHSLNRARHASGQEISNLVGGVSTDIGRIESARARGYLQATGDLNLTNFDSKPNAAQTTSFFLALAGNLGWALAGLIAITPVGIEAMVFEKVVSQFSLDWARFVRAAPREMLVPRLVQEEMKRRGQLSVVASTGAALMVSFANGLPTETRGGDVSVPIIEIENQLTALNSQLCTSTLHAVYPTFLSLMAGWPPSANIDAQQYAGVLEVLLRHTLFAGYYENGGASGKDIDTAKIQSDARNQLLRRLIVASGKIADGRISSTAIDKKGPGKLVEPAVNLIGGVEALELGEYELVVEQLHRAIRELNLQGGPNVDADGLRNDFNRAETIVLSARTMDSGIGISNWGRAAVPEGLAAFQPRGINPWFAEVNSIEIRKKDLNSANIRKGGAVAYSAEQFRVRGHGYLGGEQMEDEYQQVQRGPVELSLIYKV